MGLDHVQLSVNKLAAAELYATPKSLSIASEANLGDGGVGVEGDVQGYVKLLIISCTGPKVIKILNKTIYCIDKRKASFSSQCVKFLSFCDHFDGIHVSIRVKDRRNSGLWIIIIEERVLKSPYVGLID